MQSVKTLCDWKKETIATRVDELRCIVTDAQFLCRKCGRVANQEKWLCRPVNLFIGAGKTKTKS